MNENQGYFAGAYDGIKYDSPVTQEFLGDIFGVLNSAIPMEDATSLLDIGCGRGYFLKYLDQHGFRSVCGIEPCRELIDNGLHSNIYSGSFENNEFPDSSFDVVFTCHTLHHLPESRPIYAVAEMLRIARRFVVIVEVNNTNIPMLSRSLLLRRSEMNAYRYNIYRVKSMMAEAGCDIVLNAFLSPIYLSGNSFIHRIMARIGTPPYNISIGKKPG